VLSALDRGWEVYGLCKGYGELMAGRDPALLTAADVRGITHLGGTILGTTNKGNPFRFPTQAADGSWSTIDRSDELIAAFRRLGIDALIAIGGDGSMRIAHQLAEKGLPVVGVPKTIDNDLAGTVVTFGFDTAVTVATDAIDRLHTTAEAHERVFVVELMGRYAGWIALHAGLAGTADVILIPEIPFDIAAVYRKIEEREASGRHFSIVVVAEGAKPLGGTISTRGEQEAGREVRLGGIAERVATAITEGTGKETRAVVLGHVQRGGQPTARDRILAQRCGAAAVRVIAEGKRNVMVALDPPIVRTVPLIQAAERIKAVPLDSDTVQTVRNLGVCLGD
jgi:6-phosphofructokinase 1